MDFLKKLLKERDALGIVIIGVIFIVVGGLVVIFGDKSTAGDFLVPLVFVVIGIVLTVLGIIRTRKVLTESGAQYDRVSGQDPAVLAEMRARTPVDPDEPVEDFVYHFTGKMNQSQIMKDAHGQPVYEAVCGGVTLVKDTAFTFRNCLTGEEQERMIGHTVTLTSGLPSGFRVNLASGFTVDKTSVWDVLAGMGYGFSFGMNGLAPHYEVTRWGENVGYVENAGTGLMDERYKDSAVGKIPTSGIFRVHGRRSDVPGLFLICFALSRTDETLS